MYDYLTTKCDNAILQAFLTYEIIRKATHVCKEQKKSFRRCAGRESQQRCSIKKVVLKTQNFYRKTPVLESLFNKVAGLQVTTFCLSLL